MALTLSFTEYFKGLSDWAQYTLYAAVRGPDRETPPARLLKEEITCRIRVIIFEITSAGVIPGTVNKRTFDGASLGVVQVALASPEALDRHYLQHLLSAIHRSKDHEIWGGFASRVMSDIVHAMGKSAPIESGPGGYIDASMPVAQ